MQFDLVLDKTDFDTLPVGAFDEFDSADFNIEAEFLPGDPSVGVQEDWDIDVFFEGKRVTWDLKSSVLRSIEEKAVQMALEHAAEALIDRWEADHA